jgi:glycosyltransferase involved in cell wall biosynthesis
VSNTLFVVLATCNGQSYLEEQLASIDRQSRAPDHILVSDDLSDDKTFALLQAWAGRSKRVQLLERTASRLGALGNFSRLLSAAFDAGADLVAPCDQDDVWMPEKLEHLEASLISSSGPAAAISDLSVVDPFRRVLHRSFWNYQRFPFPDCTELRHLAVMNAFPGCAMMINRKLMSLALPIPMHACMHDWWLALIAAAAGQIIVSPLSLVEYRQHAGNLIGSRGGGVHYAVRRGISRLGSRQSLTKAALQAQAAATRLDGRASPKSITILEKVGSCAGSGWLQRRMLLVRAGAGKRPMLRNAWFYLSC